MTNASQPLAVDREALDAADSHLRAAVVLLAGPACDAPHAAHHLLRAQQLLQHHPDEATGDHRTIGEVSATSQISEEDLRRLESLAGGPPWDEVDPSDLERPLEVLASSIARARGQGSADPRPGSRRRLGWLLILIAIAGVALLAGSLWRDAAPQGPWRATFYPRPDLEGSAEVVHRSKVDLEVLDRPPVPGLPRRGFSVRWETCLTVDEPRSVLFQLVSAGSARLRVDGTTIVEAWQPHSLDSRSREIDLAAGHHHLQLDYADQSDLARVALLTTISPLGEPATEPPDHLPVDRLRAPRSGTCDEPSGP